jgi:AcrR family transcriptional regulator
MDRREAILEAATRLSLRWGFRKTTIEDIAQACGLERASVYYYFKNKDAILAEVVRREVGRQSVAVFEAQDREKTAAAKLRALFRGHLKAFSASEFARVAPEDKVNVFQVFPEAFVLLRAHRENLLELIRNIVNIGIESGEFHPVDARQVADGIRSFIVGHSITFYLDQAASDAAMTTAFDAMVRGLQANPS